MSDALTLLLALLKQQDGINDKAALAALATEKFRLIQDKSVYYCDDFALRFSASANQNFRNTVTSLSSLQKFDDRPFIVCLVTPLRNHTYLSNTTFLKKISHSSQDLRENNIRGSFNGSDIIREFEGITNTPENIERLFNIHVGLGFAGNLPRLVEATSNISPAGEKFMPSQTQRETVLRAPARAISFVSSRDALTLKAELDAKVLKFKNEILIAALIENVNVRGRIIEYLIAGEDARLRREIVAALLKREHGIPSFKTKNNLGDYTRDFTDFFTTTDVKTKIMILDSNPKAYNLDKVLEFLSSERSVFMFYFVGVEPGKGVDTVLVSMFQQRLLDSTILLRHWAGRNSRGVSQFEGKTIGRLIRTPESEIDHEKSSRFLDTVLAL